MVQKGKNDRKCEPPIDTQLDKYAVVTYKNGSEDADKAMQDINAPEYTEPYTPMDPTNRAGKFENYDQNLHNLDENKKNHSTWY